MQAKIDKLVSKGYARKVTANPSKPVKIRLVWDAAPKSHNKSLNDFLMSGHNLLTPLFNILNEFRVGLIANVFPVT